MPEKLIYNYVKISSKVKQQRELSLATPTIITIIASSITDHLKKQFAKLSMAKVRKLFKD